MRRSVYGGILQNFTQSSPTSTTTDGDGVFLLAQPLDVSWCNSAGFNPVLSVHGFVNESSIPYQSFAFGEITTLFISGNTNTVVAHGLAI